MKNQVCTSCGSEQPHTNFPPRPLRRGLCRDCNNSLRNERGYSKAWYEANKNRLNEEAKVAREKARRQKALEAAESLLAETAADDITRALALLAHPQVRAALREALKEDLTFLD